MPASTATLAPVHALAPVPSAHNEAQSDEGPNPTGEPDPDELTYAGPTQQIADAVQIGGVEVGRRTSTEADAGVGRRGSKSKSKSKSKLEMEKAAEREEGENEREKRERQAELEERERERERRLKDDVRRFYALAELVDTERAYVRDLRVLVEVYLSSLGAFLPFSSIPTPSVNVSTPDSASAPPSSHISGLPPISNDPAAYLTVEKPRRRSQPVPSRESVSMFMSPVGISGAASAAMPSSTFGGVASAEDATAKTKEKEKRPRRMSLGTLSLGRGHSTPSIPVIPDAAGSSHYTPHSQTPAGRASTESVRGAAHHRHSVDISPVSASASAKLQKKNRPGHGRSQSATSVSSFAIGFAPGLTPGFGGVVPPSSFAPHRGRLSADLDARSSGTGFGFGRRSTASSSPSPSPSRTNSLPLLSTLGSSATTAAASRSSTFSEGGPSSWINLRPGFLQSAHASGLAVALSEAERDVLARSAAEILGLHEHLVRRVDDALREMGCFFDAVAMDRAEDVGEVVKAVCRIFSSEAKQGSFKSYEAFCAGHTEALDAVRRVSRSKHSEWAEWERRCKTEAAELLLGHRDVQACPIVMGQLSDEPEQLESGRRMGFELTSGFGTGIDTDDDGDALLVPPDRAALLGNHDARSSTSTLRERRRHSAAASTFEHELGLGAKSSTGSLRAGKSTALKHTKSDPTSGEKGTGTPPRMASRASLKLTPATEDAVKRMSKSADPSSPSRMSFNHDRDTRQGAEKERQAVMKLNFADYLIKPIQRVCKYPLLFEQLRTPGWRTNGNARSRDRASAVEFPRSGEGRQSRASFTFGDEDDNESDDEDDDEDDDADVDVFVEKALATMREVTRAVDEARRRRDIEVKSKLIVDRIVAGNPNSPHVVLSVEGDGSENESSHGHGEFGHGHGYIANASHRPPTRSLSFSSAFSRSRSRVSGLNHGADSEYVHGHGQGQGIVNVMGRLLLTGPPSRIFLESLGACLLAGTLDVVVRDMSHLKTRMDRAKRDSMLSMSSMASMASSTSRSNCTSAARAHSSNSQKDPVKVKYLAAFLYVGGYVLLVKTIKAGVYAARHWFSLADEGVEVVDVSEEEALLPCSFHLIFYATGHILELTTACQREKMLWLQAIASARTVRPGWECEPVPTLSVSAPPAYRASMEISDTEIPPVPAVPSVLDDKHPQGIQSKSSSSTLKTEATVRPRGAGPNRRQSLTGSTVRALFAYGAGHGSDSAAGSVPSTVLVRRVSATRRAQTDRLLADVLSEPLLAARLHAKSHDEVLFRDPEPPQGAGLGMGAMAKNRLMGRESVLVSTHCPKSAPPSTPAFPPQEQKVSALPASTSESGMARQGPVVLRAMSLKGKRSFSRKSFGMRLTLPNSLPEVDTGDSQPPSTSPASPESPLPVAMSSRERHSQSQCSSESPAHSTARPGDPPIVRVVGMDSPQPPVIELPDIMDPEDRPKRSRSLIDNVKGFFIPRSTSPSPSPTPSLSLSSSSKQLSPVEEMKAKESSNVLSRIWKNTSQRQRARSATEMSRKDGVRKLTSQKRPGSPVRTPSAPVSRRASFLSRSSTLLLRRLSTYESGLEPEEPDTQSSLATPSSSSRLHRRASATPVELRHHSSIRHSIKRRLFPSDLTPLTQVRVENST